MNRKDFIQLISSGFSEPRMLAKATADYYTRCRDRLMNKLTLITESIVNDTVSEVTDQYLNIQFKDEQGKLHPALVSISDLSQSIHDAINSAGDEAVTYDDITTSITNLYDTQTISINVGEVCSQLGDAADSLSIAIAGYSALASEAMMTASDFYQRVKLLIPEVNENILNITSDVYSIISNSSNSLSVMYNTLSDYFGIMQNMQRTEQDDFELGNPAIEQYTGVNPTVALYSSLDIANPISWIGAVWKFQIDAIVGISKWVWNGVAQIGKWFIKSVDETFINPVDVETTGDTYEFFNNYATMDYDISMIDEGVLNRGCISTGLKSFFIDDDYKTRPIWFNLKVIAYQLTVNEDKNGHLHLLVNRYLKPTNIDKLLDLMSSCGYTPDPNNDETGTQFNNFDWTSFCIQLQDTDLSLSKDASEKEIAAGLVMTNLIDRWLTKVFSAFKGLRSLSSVSSSSVNNAMSAYLSGDVDYTMLPYEIDQWIRKFKGYGLSEIMYAHLGIWQEDDSSLNSDYTQITSRSLQNELLERVLYDQVTNKDMLLLTCCFAAQNSGGYWPEIHTPFTGGSWNLIYPNNVAGQDMLGTQTAFALLLTHMLLTEDMPVRHPQSGEYVYPKLSENFDGVYLVYSRSSLDIIKNSNVKTDAQNMEAAKNWMITAFVIVAAIAATIYLGVKVTKLIKNMRIRQAQIDCNMRSIGMMMANGGLEKEVNALYKDTTKLMLKNKLVGTILGTTGATASSMLTGAISSVSIPTVSSTNLQPVIDLIKP